MRYRATLTLSVGCIHDPRRYLDHRHRTTHALDLADVHVASPLFGIALLQAAVASAERVNGVVDHPSLGLDLRPERSFDLSANLLLRGVVFCLNDEETPNQRVEAILARRFRGLRFHASFLAGKAASPVAFGFKKVTQCVVRFFP